MQHWIALITVPFTPNGPWFLACCMIARVFGVAVELSDWTSVSTIELSPLPSLPSFAKLFYPSAATRVQGGLILPAELEPSGRHGSE